MSLFLRSIYLSSALSLGYIFLLFKSNPYRRIPAAPAIVAFTAGMFAVIPVVAVKRLIPFDPNLATGGGLFLAASIEEAMKFSAFFLTGWRFRFPNAVETLDYAIYFGILGVGFAIYEDFWYIFSVSYPSWTAGDPYRFSEIFHRIVLARAFPGHILFGALAGFFVCRGRTSRPVVRIGWIAGGFAIALLSHAGFNRIATLGDPPLLITYALVLVGIFLALRKRELTRSPFAALIDYVEGRREDWPFPRPPIDYLFAEGFPWPGKKRGGLFQFYPVLLSLAILFPLLLTAVYLLNRLVLWSG
ncbi:hypothetical protein DRJ24_01915 [Candidatus Acetothermia bacterium]|nr:MAG: hypothetical protein DRJ24_01915 [Candidatus Acetothermia bacterium]